MNCPLCNGETYCIFLRYGYWIRKCRDCDHRFAEISPSNKHVDRVYRDEYFQGDLGGYPDYLSEANILRECGRQYGSLLNHYASPGKILDIGAAAGFILKGFEESGWSGVGLEPNLSMAVYGRTYLGLRMETGCLEEFSATQQFDVVSMIQVVPHFFDIRRALQKAADLTRPGGLWLIETWDRESWVARVLGKHWHEYNPPSALHWFSEASLSHFIAQFGFTQIARGSPAKQINGLYAKSLLKRGLNGSFLHWLMTVFQFIPNRLVIPYPALDLFWILFQKGPGSSS
jgi:2-polyprenyl-3-methyl-5-hydroxy-6-metoxy-1,4-benzoquinol methylase